MSTTSVKTGTSKHSLRSSAKSESSRKCNDDAAEDITDSDYENENFEEDDTTLTSLEAFSESQKSRIFVNKTFTSKQIWEIERNNNILMNKILSYNKPARPKITLPNYYKTTSAAINRKKDQKKIDWENQILLRKIQTVKSSVKTYRK